MAVPAVQQDPTTGQHYYINDQGQRFNAVNGEWVAAPAAPPPAPVAVPAPAPAPVAAPVPVATPVAVAPAAVPAAAPVPNPTDQLSAMMGAASTGGVIGVDSLLAQDMSDVSDDQFRVIPEGTTVEAVIAECEITQAKGDNAAMIKLTTKVCFPETYKGITIWDYIKLGDENSRWKFKRLCRVTGLLDPTGSRFTGRSHAEFKGHVIRFDVRNDVYNGIKNNKVAAGYDIAFETPGLAQPGAAPTIAVAPVVAPLGQTPVAGPPQPAMVTPMPGAPPAAIAAPAAPAVAVLPAAPAVAGPQPLGVPNPAWPPAPPQ